MRRKLLTIDAIVNLVLGIFLVAFPAKVIHAAGMPGEGAFYANILGGVLFGVGMALLIERFRPPLRMVGLGLGGAVSINLCGGLALAGWLALGPLQLSTFGLIALWGLVVLLVGLSAVELYGNVRKREVFGESKSG